MTKGLEKSNRYDSRGLATLRANGALIILEELLHLLVKDLQLLGCEGTTVFSPLRRRLVTATSLELSHMSNSGCPCCWAS